MWIARAPTESREQDCAALEDHGPGPTHRHPEHSEAATERAPARIAGTL